MGSLLVIIILAVILFILVRSPFEQATPTCPLSQEQRAWIERTINRLISIYGKARFLNTRTLLPDDQGFPHPYTNSEEFATQVFEKICAIMDIDPDNIDLEFGETEIDLDASSDEYGSRYIPGSYTPEYDQLVTLNLDLVYGFEQLVAVVAHELSHVSLDREVPEEIDHSEDDYEATVDIVSIFLGFGLFMARVNTAYFSLNRSMNLGYLSPPVICYALAFISWKRREDISTWKRYLSEDTITLITISSHAIQEAHRQTSLSHTESGAQATNRSATLPHVEHMLHQAMTQELSPPSRHDVPQIEQLWEEAKARKQNMTDVKRQDEIKKS